MTGTPALGKSLPRRLLIALAVLVACTTTYAIFAGDRLELHTLNNH